MQKFVAASKEHYGGLCSAYRVLASSSDFFLLTTLLVLHSYLSYIFFFFQRTVW